MPLLGIRKSLPHIRPSHLFESAVLSHPTDLAIYDIESQKEYTFDEISKRANQLARFLIKAISDNLPVNDDDGSERQNLLFAVCMAPSSELITCLLAILKLEAAYVPIDVLFPTSRIEYIVNDSKPNLILTNGNVPALKDSKLNQIPVIDLKDSLFLIENEDSRAIHIGSYVDNPLFAVLYTSGSTGLPKGVKLGWNAVLNRITWLWDTFPFKKDEVGCFKTALTFVDSISEIYGPLLSAHKILIIPKSLTTEVEGLVAIMAHHKVERLLLVPSLLRSIMFHYKRKSTKSLTHLRLLFCSGETLPRDLLEEFFTIFANDETEICNIYGCTETLGDLTYARFTRSNAVNGGFLKNVPIGTPILNSDVYLVNNEMKEVPEGEMGEIVASGLNLCDGYIGIENSEKLITNCFNKEIGYEILYRTGDYGRLENGIIYYEGRTDSQIKIRGHRIDLMEVEACLQSIEGVNESHVMCYHAGQVDQMLLSFYTGLESSPCSANVRSELDVLLPAYMIPQVHKLEEMPLLVNGKVDRQQLLDIYERNTRDFEDRGRIILENCPNNETKIADILLQSTLKALGPSAPDCISLDDNYYKIGGNSLNILLVLSYLQDIGYYIGIQDFLAADNFRQMIPKIYTSSEKSDTYLGNENAQEEKYFARQIIDEDVEGIVRLMADSFTTKAELDIAAETTYECMTNLLRQFPYTNSGNPLAKLSFVLCDPKNGEIVGVSINEDFIDGVDLEPTGALVYIFGFLLHCETNVSLDTNGQHIMHSLMMGTRNTSGENPSIIHSMEVHNIEIAQRYNYDSIVTTNTSPVTQQICQDIFGYTVLGTFQANSWVANDGNRPFGHSPDSLRVSVDIKYIQN